MPQNKQEGKPGRERFANEILWKIWKDGKWADYSNPFKTRELLPHVLFHHIESIVLEVEKKATEEAVRKCVEVCRSTELFKIPLNMWAVGYNDAAKDIALSLEKLNDK